MPWGILQGILQGDLKAAARRHTEGALKKGEVKDTVIGRQRGCGSRWVLEFVSQTLCHTNTTAPLHKQVGFL